MAEGKDVVEELEKEITCAICHDHYTEPKVLPCCHYYCKQCLHSLALRTGLDRPFSCPECRNSTTLPQRSADKLPSAFFVNRLKEMHSKLERAHGKVEAKCEMCVEGGKAEAFCRQCVQFICAECVSQHGKMRMLVGHKIASFSKLKEGGTKGMTAPAEPSLQTCTVHEQPMNIYCFDCKTLICRDCTIKIHNSQTHNYEFIKVAAPQMKKELIQQLDPLKETKETLSHAVKEVQTTKSEVAVQGESVKQHIHSFSDELIKIIENRKRELLTEASDRVKQKLANLSSQEERLSTESALIQSVIEYTEQCVEHSTDDEVMCMHAELQCRIKKQVEEQHKELEPVEEADMGVEVSCVEELKQLCQDKAMVVQLIDAANCTVTVKRIKLAEVNKVSDFSVVPNILNWKPPASRQINIECQLKSVVDGSITTCKVTRSQANEYRIQYTPTVRGRHELTVTVNGQEVAGSPFPVHVSIHPTQLGKPVRVITTQGLCRDVSVSSAGNVLIAFGEKNIMLYDRSGKCLGAPECELAYPLGMTIDSSDDSVFVVDRKKITKFSADLRKLNEISVNIDTNWSSLVGLTVVRGELMMCNNKDGCIMVYTTELKYVRRIGSRGDGPGQFSVEIRGLSSDKQGNLYVSDRDKRCVQVFSNGGEFIRSFGRDQNNMLEWPFGVYVAGQYVYVADLSNHKLAVFTTEGKYVTSFGQWGGSEGNFNYPYGVCVDVDGFVYVCDSINRRLQIF